MFEYRTLVYRLNSLFRRRYLATAQPIASDGSLIGSPQPVTYIRIGKRFYMDETVEWSDLPSPVLIVGVRVVLGTDRVVLVPVGAS